MKQPYLIKNKIINKILIMSSQNQQIQQILSKMNAMEKTIISMQMKITNLESKSAALNPATNSKATNSKATNSKATKSKATKALNSEDVKFKSADKANKLALKKEKQIADKAKKLALKKEKQIADKAIKLALKMEKKLALKSEKAEKKAVEKAKK